MFGKKFKNLMKKPKEESKQIDNQQSLKYIQFLIASKIKELVGSDDFSYMDLLRSQVDNQELNEFIKTILTNNEFIKTKDNHMYRIGIEVLLSKDDNISRASEDLVQYLPLMLNSELSGNYTQKNAAIVWNTLFDDFYFRSQRETLTNHLSHFLHSGHSYRILDLGTGNGDILYPLLAIAEMKSISIEIDLVDKVPIFINFLNRKITSNITTRIENLKSKSCVFNYAFHNYNVIGELWDLPKFQEPCNFILMSFCSEHLSDEELIQLGLQVRAHMPADGVFFILEADEIVRKSIRSILSFGMNIKTVEDPIYRLKRLLSDIFHSINKVGNVIELA